MVRKLSIIVAGQLIGKVKMISYTRSTIVDGGGIIGSGIWDMKPKEIEEMLYKRMEYSKKVTREDIEIKYS